VDGFDQDDAESKRDERAVILRRLLASKCDALESFELPDCLLDTGAPLVENRGQWCTVLKIARAGTSVRGHRQRECLAKAFRANNLTKRHETSRPQAISASAAGAAAMPRIARAQTYDRIV
jgi:hypothetical protein